MTSDAGRILMCAFEREFRGGVVEAAKFLPTPSVMAGFAGLSGRVWIVVTAGAGLISEVILPSRRRRRSRDVRRISIVYVG